jgi:hypothetical protein
MSAQAHTHKMRLLAEASLVKVQYPGKVAVNQNPIYAIRNCSPDFRVLQYPVKPLNKRFQHVFTIPPLVSISTPVNGSGAGSVFTNTINGSSASSVPTTTLNGGSASNP